jgi:hypothetical protein
VFFAACRVTGLALENAAHFVGGLSTIPVKAARAPAKSSQTLTDRFRSRRTSRRDPETARRFHFVAILPECRMRAQYIF